MWNSFPWHPHKSGSLQSNRAPVAGELQEGRGFLEQLVGMSDLDMVVAVGRKAETGLKPYVSESTGELRIGDSVLRFATVRHPSFGGKGDFVKGMATVLGNTVTRVL
ncbi:hypothetical protein GI364_08475 [Alicyclobacillus sp. SO9]|nr:hypothetical protein GI364_08475 [Alicyclobacillus sp. SO9]